MLLRGVLFYKLIFELASIQPHAEPDNVNPVAKLFLCKLFSRAYLYYPLLNLSVLNACQTCQRKSFDKLIAVNLLLIMPVLIFS